MSKTTTDVLAAARALFARAEDWGHVMVQSTLTCGQFSATEMKTTNTTVKDLAVLDHAIAIERAKCAADASPPRRTA